MNTIKNSKKQKNAKEIKQFEIYYINLPEQNSSIQGGFRPCVVVSNNTCNKFSPVISVVPTTSSLTKNKIPTHVDIELKKPSTILCEQIMTVPKDKLLNKVKVEIDEDKIRKIKKALRIQMGI